MNTAKQILSALEFLEIEVEKMIHNYVEIPTDNIIDAERDYDGHWMFDFDNTARAYEIPIILDEEIETVGEFVDAVACIVDDQLDTPYPDDEDGPTLVWNPSYKVAHGMLIVDPDWEIVEGYWDSNRIKRKRLDNITVS